MKVQRLTIAGLCAMAVILSLVIAFAPRATYVYGDTRADLGDFTVTLSSFGEGTSDVITVIDNRNARLVNYEINMMNSNPRFEVLSLFELNSAFGSAPAPSRR